MSLLIQQVGTEFDYLTINSAVGKAVLIVTKLSKIGNHRFLLNIGPPITPKSKLFCFLISTL